MKDNKAYSRKAPSELEDPLTQMFQLRFYIVVSINLPIRELVRNMFYYRSCLYYLTATYGDNPVIALDAPYYVGSLNAQEVIKGEMTSASDTLACLPIRLSCHL